ncbi:hypothetical protein Pelo_18032 [Pelomyxa schiedti]|nr:hypothetical protein Pelo_18032 [Pelomyxa schiedti]
MFHISAQGLQNPLDYVTPSERKLVMELLCHTASTLGQGALRNTVVRRLHGSSLTSCDVIAIMARTYLSDLIVSWPTGRDKWEQCAHFVPLQYILLFYCTYLENQMRNSAIMLQGRHCSNQLRAASISLAMAPNAKHKKHTSTAHSMLEHSSCTSKGALSNNNCSNHETIHACNSFKLEAGSAYFKEIIQTNHYHEQTASQQLQKELASQLQAWNSISPISQKSFVLSEVRCRTATILDLPPKGSRQASEQNSCMDLGNSQNPTRGLAHEPECAIACYFQINMAHINLKKKNAPCRYIGTLKEYTTALPASQNNEQAPEHRTSSSTYYNTASTFTIHFVTSMTTTPCNTVQLN